MRTPFLALASLVVAALAPLALAAPNLVYPLQAQRPPVARSGESWTFTILAGTFSSSNGGTLSLATASTLPTWATFDPSSGTFSGTPSSSDLGSVAVAVRATDSSDRATATGRFTLLVVDPASDPAPYVRLPLESQLASAAAISGGGTLTPGGALKVPPQWSFSFGFEQYTIENALQQRMYYTAFVHGTTSLPSWITFDNETVTFNGLAPYTPGEYEVDVVASERFGYGDARQSFTILVTKHAFELVGTNGTGDGVFPTLNATLGGPVNYSIPLDRLRLDNSTVNASDISSASADFAQAGVSFLALDGAALSIMGEVPANYSPTSTLGVPIPLTLVDRNNDTLQANLSLVVYPSLFDTAAFPALIDVQVGKKFEQDLSAYLAQSSSRRRALPSSLKGVFFNSSIAPAAASSWLSFDPSAFTLSGTAPSAVPDYQNVSVTLDALDPTTSAVSRASFVLSVVEGGGNSTFPTSSPSADKGLSSSAKLGLGLGLGLGLPLLILALVLVACCVRKRRRSDGAAGSSGTGGRRPGGLLISHPRPMSTSPAPNGAFSASAVTIVGSAGHGGVGDGGGKGEKASPPVVSSAGWGSSDKGYVPAVGGAEHMALPVAVTTGYPHASHKLDTLHEADEPPPTPTEPKGPKRFDVMGRLFRSESGQSFLDAVRGKGKGKGRERSQRSLSSLSGGGAGAVGGGGAAVRHETSLFGLGIDDPASDETRRIVVVSDGGRGIDGTYASPKAGPAAGPSGRVSSWESGASSSLFYSDRSAASGSPRSMPHRRTASRTGSASGSGTGSAGYASPVPSASSGSSNVSVGGTRRGPASIPQRRRDFLPLPLKSPTAPDVDSPAPSPIRDTYDVTPPLNLTRDVSGGTMSDGVEEDEVGGIRMVGSHSGSSSSTQDRHLDTSAAVSEARHFQQYSSPSRSGSYPSDSPSQDSLVAPPRLISFTQERRPPPFSRTFTSQTSLAARRPSEPTDTEQREDGDEAVEDAWEDDEDDDRPRPRSAVYVPADGQGSPTTSAVFYPSAAAASQRETWQSRSAYGDSVLSRTSFDDEVLDGQRLSATGGGVRYVGSVASTNVSPAMASHFTHDSASRYSQSDVPATPRSIAFSAASSQPTAATSADSRHKRSSSYLEPLRVSLHVGEPFRFVPRLEPAPFASISSSPGRNGPPRATYQAWIETALLDEALARRFSPDELDDGLAPLPDWVHFDGAAIEVFGLARRIDAGTWPLVVVERKAQRTPGSPTRAGGARVSEDADVTEQVVGRFELVVVHRDGDAVGLGVEQVEDEGELRIVTY